MNDNKIHILSHGSEVIYMALNLGLSTTLKTSIHASKKGLAIKLDGVTVASGKDVRELNDQFKAFVEESLAVSKK